MAKRRASNGERGPLILEQILRTGSVSIEDVCTRSAAELIGNGETIAVTVGATTMQVTRSLPMNRQITIVTNNGERGDEFEQPAGHQHLRHGRVHAWRMVFAGGNGGDSGAASSSARFSLAPTV